MTSATDLLADAFDRVREAVHEAVKGLTAAQLTERPDEKANSIAWLVWHLTRVQDDHLADAAGTEQLWTADGWYDRFALPFPVSATGYGQSSDEVAAVRVNSRKLLTDYHDAVHQRTVAFVGGLRDADLRRVVDEAWTPPVTLAVRLVSVISDGLQHAGQAGYLRGLVRRR
ncbi:mycothiol transferase [Kitasatospora sp. HPMI-4]|uniref:mycothiol transferase n=1 Tax=Kitasatospora sp. HPMI-4 TaxID=3448443 RepID=UPI003F1C0E0A